MSEAKKVTVFACTGAGTSCTVSMAADQNAIASFRFVGYIP